MKISPLFTDTESREFQAECRRLDAVHRNLHENRPEHTNLNEIERKKIFDAWYKKCDEICKESTTHREKHRVEGVKRVFSRPYDYLLFLTAIVGFYRQQTISKDERTHYAVRGYSELEHIFTKEVVDTFEKFNTPENRWWTREILQGFLDMPKNVAATGAMKYFRTELAKKQKSWKGTSIGLLSTEHCWKQNDVHDLMHILFSKVGEPLVFAENLMSYERMKDRDEDDYDYSVSYFATRTGVNTILIGTMIEKLNADGVEAPTFEVKVQKVTKPRKVHVFSVDDKVTSKNMMDLPVGSIIEKTYELYPTSTGYDKTFKWLGNCAKQGEKAFYNYIDISPRAYSHHARQCSGSKLDSCKFIVKELPNAKL